MMTLWNGSTAAGRCCTEKTTTQGDAAHDQRSRRRPSHCTQSQARAARRPSVRCGYRDAAYYTHTHVHTPPTSVSVGAYESDNESDDAVDDQKGRRRQPESDEARAVHILRCLSRESQGAPPSRAQVQRPKKKDLSYCSLVLMRPVDKPNFNILDPQGPVPRKLLEVQTY